MLYADASILSVYVGHFSNFVLGKANTGYSWSIPQPIDKSREVLQYNHGLCPIYPGGSFAMSYAGMRDYPSVIIPINLSFVSVNYACRDLHSFSV